MYDSEGNKVHLVTLYGVAHGDTPEESVKQMLKDMGSGRFEGFVEVRNGSTYSEPIYEAELRAMTPQEMN
jgi:hypothetical protein